jgi:hypothetical protein
MNGWFTVPGKEDNLMTLGHAPFLLTISVAAHNRALH